MRKTVLACLGLCGLYLLGAGIGGFVPGPQNMQPKENEQSSIHVLLVSGPIHYDFALPLTAETRSVFGDLSEAGIAMQDPRAKWLLVGWGAREFYTTTGGHGDLNLQAIWRAATGDASVLRVDLWGALPEGHSLPHIELTSTEYTALLRAIRASFASGQDAQPIAIDASGFTASDRFFEAEGRFHLFRTCNTWVSRMIRSAGLDFGAWMPTPYAVRLSLMRFHTP